MKNLYFGWKAKCWERDIELDPAAVAHLEEEEEMDPTSEGDWGRLTEPYRSDVLTERSEEPKGN
jgi:hypothetical protein